MNTGKFLSQSIWLLFVQTAIPVSDGKWTAIRLRIREDQVMGIYPINTRIAVEINIMKNRRKTLCM